MNKKGFSLIELLAVVVILGLISIIALGSYNRQLKKTREESFKMAEKTFINDVKDAYADCLSNTKNLFCSNHPNFGYQNETISLKELVETGYSEKIKNPYHTDSYCDMNLSYVKVRVNNTSMNNRDISYEVCLVCGDVKSTGCTK